MPTSDAIHLVTLETSGNQATIFATNKLRNIVGASELIYRVGTEYIARAIKKTTGRAFETEKICEEKPIEDTKGPYVEVALATSGKALLLIRGEELAQKFITEWSALIVDEAPGIDAFAAYSKIPLDLSRPLDEAKEYSFPQVYADAMKRYSLAKMNHPSPLARFQRIPIVAECQYSGRPASKSRDGIPLSRAALAQIDVSRGKDFKNRLKSLYPEGMDWIIEDGNGLEFLEKDQSIRWAAVVHADGNGLGQLFIKLDKIVKKLIGEHATGRDYINHYRAFSDALDKVNQAAFKETVKEVWKNDKKANIVPIVVGGDDLTAVMDGAKAIEFTRKYMEKFSSRTAEHPAMKDILKKDGLSRLGMCAGLAIVKPHFPFAQAYDLAAELTKSAKKVKKPSGADAIALDFHVLYDSVAISIEDIREKLSIKDQRLTAKPYALSKGSGSSEDESEEGKRASQAWLELHDISRFDKAVCALGKRDSEGKRLLPSSQSHTVRGDLFAEARETQEVEWKFLLNKYPEFKNLWSKVADTDLLYHKMQTDEYYMYFTYFLDALEAVEFVSGNDPSEPNNPSKSEEEIHA
jgi:hypothetical protein